ncbi:hypothetical protein C8R41DRAFT_52960 [Lentinula lateritia]|uniref:Secreted protein n=1 Tax=Lentinula lateritia TaxID=40482 RepID=A0ABQ8V4C5_9AGAR|nr:hypothetical protein C8R41DRAFT_52960 [Lentinula lateritia]
MRLVLGNTSGINIVSVFLLTLVCPPWGGNLSRFLRNSGILHHFRTIRNSITGNRVKGQVHNKHCDSRAHLRSSPAYLEWYRSYNEKEELLLVTLN